MYHFIIQTRKKSFTTCSSVKLNEHAGVPMQCVFCLSLYVDCGEPQLSDSNLNYTYDSTKVGSLANLTCPQGYTLSGTETITCTANNSWSASGWDVNCTINGIVLQKNVLQAILF